MNKRIRELNHKAMSIVLNGDDPDGDVDRMYIPSEFTNKFAELIVQECILIVKMGITRDGNNTEKYLRSMEHIRQIEKHFGVES